MSRLAALRPSGRDLLIGLSLANLCFLRMWGEVFALDGPGAYFSHVSNADIYAMMANVLLLGLAFAVSASVLRAGGRWGRRALVTGFVLVLVAQLNQLGPQLNPGILALVDPWKSGKYLDVFAALLAAGLIVAAALRWPRRFLAGAVGLILVLSPFVAVTFGRAALLVMRLDPTEALAARTPPVDTTLAHTEGPRVVLVVLDAMGRRHAIEDRPDSIAMPTLDRLRAEAFDATQVVQIGTQTKIAVPGMLSGVEVETSEPQGPEELLLTLDDGRTVPWSETDDLFREAQALGGVGVIAGWYHPYCRLFDHVNACATYPARTVGSQARETGFWRALAEQQRALLPFIALRLRQVEIVERQREDLARAAVLGGRGFVFLHVIAPHTPWIWDAETDDYTLTEFHPDGMYFNLELADRMLGDIRAAMERAGHWDEAAVIVTSDHVAQYRPRWIAEPDDARVPFIVKLPGAAGGAAYGRPFNALLVHELASALLRDEIPDYDSLAGWLDARAEPLPPAAAEPSPLERGILEQTNRARTDPAGFAEELERLLPHFDGMVLKLPGQRVGLRTNAGPAAVREAIAFLRAQAPLPPLTWADGLWRAASDHVRDQGPRGSTSHTGNDGSTMGQRMSRYGRWQSTAAENIDYGSADARDVLVSLIVDDGVPSRGHRTNIFNPALRVMGAACGPHARYDVMCVMNYAGGYLPRTADGAGSPP